MCVKGVGCLGDERLARSRRTEEEKALRWAALPTENVRTEHRVDVHLSDALLGKAEAGDVVPRDAGRSIDNLKEARGGGQGAV